jgi:predicted RNA-binding Zn-ribbon protein involved in translation (DUF1610 family)
MERRPSPDFGKKYMARNLILFIPLAIVFFLLWRRWGTFDTIFYLLIGLFVGGVILGLVWDRLRLSTFTCPRCGLTISEPTIMARTEGDPIDYHCPVCDIVWETGLREGGAD